MLNDEKERVLKETMENNFDLKNMSKINTWTR